MAFLRVVGNTAAPITEYFVFNNGAFQNGHSKGGNIGWSGYTVDGGFNSDLSVTTPTTSAHAKGSVINKQVDLSKYTKFKGAFRYSATDYTYEGDISSLSGYGNVILGTRTYSGTLYFDITINNPVGGDQSLNRLLFKQYDWGTAGANLLIYSISFY